MPVQINEIIIRANIVEQPVKAEGSKNNAPGDDAINKDELIKECTEIILEVLKSKTER